MYLAIITLPLLGSIVSGFFGRKVGVSGAQLITCTSVIVTTLLAIVAFFEVGLNNIPVSVNLFRWIDSESLNVLWGFRFDSLTVCCISISFILYIDAVLVIIQLYKVIFVNKFCSGDGFICNNSGMDHLNIKYGNRYLSLAGSGANQYISCMLDKQKRYYSNTTFASVIFFSFLFITIILYNSKLIYN